MINSTGPFFLREDPREELVPLKLAFHGADKDTDTDTDILADFRARIIARMSACPATSLFSLTHLFLYEPNTHEDPRRLLSDTRDFPRVDSRE